MQKTNGIFHIFVEPPSPPQHIENLQFFYVFKMIFRQF